MHTWILFQNWYFWCSGALWLVCNSLTATGAQTLKFRLPSSIYRSWVKCSCVARDFEHRVSDHLVYFHFKQRVLNCLEYFHFEHSFKLSCVFSLWTQSFRLSCVFSLNTVSDCLVCFQEWWASLAPVFTLCWTCCNRAWTRGQGHSVCTTRHAWLNWATSLCTSCVPCMTHLRLPWDTCEPLMTFCTSSFDICRLIRPTTVSGFWDANTFWLCVAGMPLNLCYLWKWFVGGGAEIHCCFFVCDACIAVYMCVCGLDSKCNRFVLSWGS